MRLLLDPVLDDSGTPWFNRHKGSYIVLDWCVPLGDTPPGEVTQLHVPILNTPHDVGSSGSPLSRVLSSSRDLRSRSIKSFVRLLKGSPISMCLIVLVGAIYSWLPCTAHMPQSFRISLLSAENVESTSAAIHYFLARNRLRKRSMGCIYLKKYIN